MPTSKDLKFKESKYTHFFHDLRIYVCGVDVSSHLRERVSVSISDAVAPSTATVTLDNALDKFTFTKDNENELYGDDLFDRYSEKAKHKIVNRKRTTDGKKTTRDLILTVQDSLDAQLKNIIASLNTEGAKYADNVASTDVKVAVDEVTRSLSEEFFQESTSETTRQAILDKVAESFPGLDLAPIDDQYATSKANRGVASSADRYDTQTHQQVKQNVQAQSNVVNEDTNVALYDFDSGDLVIGKNDPIIVFAHNPFTENDEWYPAFTGFVNTVHERTDERTGESSITLQCYCIRGLMKTLRINTNPAFAQFEPDLVLAGKGNNGYFADIVKPNTTAWSVFLQGWSLEQSICQLVTGSFSPKLDSDGSTKKTATSKVNSGRVGRFTLGEVIRYPGTTPPAAAAPSNIPTVAGSSGADGTTQANPVTIASSSKIAAAQPVTPTDSTLVGVATSAGTADAADLLDLWHTISVFGGRVEGPFGTRKAGETFLTESQMSIIGENSYLGGINDPWSRQIHFLLPDAGTNVGTLAKAAVDDNPQQYTFSNRFDIINKTAKLLDYQFTTSPSGDLLVEFPIYDFVPEDFGAPWAPLFKYFSHLIDSTVTPETDTIPAGIVLTGNTLEGIATNEDQTFNNLAKRVMAYSKTVAAKYGIAEVSYESAPFLSDIPRLKAYVAIMYQRALANASSLGFTAAHRPFLMPNRPIQHDRRNRLGILTSVEHTWEIGGVVTTDIAIKAIRKRIVTADGEVIYRFATGGTRMAVSYRTPQTDAGLPPTAVPSTTSTTSTTSSSATTGLRIIKDQTVYTKDTKGNPVEGKVDMAEVQPGKYLAIDPADAWLQMKAAAAKNNITISIQSAWRSTEKQTVLYNEYINGKGNLAAKPKTSTHESGRSVDINELSGTLLTLGELAARRETRTFKWLNDHASKYHFIADVSKPGDIHDEPWHWTYNGPVTPAGSKKAQEDVAKAESNGSPPTPDLRLSDESTTGITVISDEEIAEKKKAQSATEPPPNQSFQPNEPNASFQPERVFPPNASFPS